MLPILEDDVSNSPFELNSDHNRWAKRAQQKYGRTKAYWLELIVQQEGRCGFSGALLRFDSPSGTAQAGGLGVHPIYAAVDHCSPGCDDLGHEIVSFDLNDLKGHLPPECFADLRSTPSWKSLMDRWQQQAETNHDDRGAFRAIRKGIMQTPEVSP